MPGDVTDVLRRAPASPGGLWAARVGRRVFVLGGMLAHAIPFRGGRAAGAAPEMQAHPPAWTPGRASPHSPFRCIGPPPANEGVAGGGAGPGLRTAGDGGHRDCHTRKQLGGRRSAREGGRVFRHRRPLSHSFASALCFPSHLPPAWPSPPSAPRPPAPATSPPARPPRRTTTSSSRPFARPPSPGP